MAEMFTSELRRPFFGNFPHGDFRILSRNSWFFTIDAIELPVVSKEVWLSQRVDQISIRSATLANVCSFLLANILEKAVFPVDPKSRERRKLTICGFRKKKSARSFCSVCPKPASFEERVKLKNWKSEIVSKDGWGITSDSARFSLTWHQAWSIFQLRRLGISVA